MASMELLQALQAASRGDQSAIGALESFKTSNYGNFCIGLAQQIVSGSPEIRPQAALVLKNTLHAEDFAIVRQKLQAWKTLDPAMRAQVKSLLLQALSVSQDRTAHFAAMAASEVAAIELPHGEWPELIGTLMERVTSQATPNDVKLASLECLGYTADRIGVLEEIPGLDQPMLGPEVVDRMLTTIVDGCQPNKPDPMRLAALSALRNSLGFCRKNMETQAERDFIFQAICGATTSADEQVVGVAMECLDSTAQMYYDVLGDYMTAIFQLTTEVMRNPNQPAFVKIKAIEFWNSICVQESDLLIEEAELAAENIPLDRAPCPQYVKTAMDALVPLLLELLTQQEEDIEDDNANSPSASAAYCLDLVSLVVQNDICRIVVPFVEANIASENWRLRGAAITAFGCILEGTTTDVIGPYVVQAIPILAQALNDANLVVKDSATHCVSNVCKHHLFALQPDQVHLMIQGLIQKLQEEQMQLASHAASAIFNIAQSCRQMAFESTNVLSAPMLPLLKALLAAADRPDAQEANLRISATSAIAELIMSGAEDAFPIFRDFLPIILQRIQATLNLPLLSEKEKEEKDNLISQLCGIAQMLFQKLPAEQVTEHVDFAMTLVLQVLQSAKATCLEDAFLVMGAVASCMDTDFVKYLPAVIPSIVLGLKSAQALDLCIISVGVVVDICTAVGPAIQPYCDQIMDALRTTLSDHNVARDIKPHVISTFGDVALAIGGAYEPYIEISSMMLMQASQQCVAGNDDDELLIFINNLRLAILEAYSGIIIGLSDDNKISLFMANIPAIFQFLQYLSMPDTSKDDRVLGKAVSLLGDIVQQIVPHNPQIKLQLNQSWVAQLIQDASALPDDEARRVANWTRGLVQQALQQ